MTPALERHLEKYLKDRVTALGGKCLKVKVDGCTGTSDRMILLPHGVMGFFELKRLGESPSARQALWQIECRKLGHSASWGATKNAVDLFLKDLEFEVGVRDPGPDYSRDMDDEA